MSYEWEPIRERLKNNKWGAFVAASLMVGSASLHIDGHCYDINNNKSYEMPDDITEMVDEIYLREKGETSYYKENSRIYKLRFPQIQGV